MKIEQLLVRFFYQKREITLQGIGTFTLSPNVIIPPESDKDLVMPEDAISFLFKPKAIEDDDLIDYIVQQTRKIKPLASADLDSYLVLGKQFLNIGKHFEIEGLGILEKSQQGDLVFNQGHFANTKPASAPVALKEKPEEEDISFAAIRNDTGKGKKKLLLFLIVLLLGGVGWGTWFLLHKNKNAASSLDNEPKTVVTHSVTDSSTAAKPDTSGINKDSAALKTNSVAPYSFKVVFKETTDKEAALIRMNERISKGHKVIMYTKDSVHYKLAEPFNLPLSDTSRIKDSLNKYFYTGKAYIEIK